MKGEQLFLQGRGGLSLEITPHLRGSKKECVMNAKIRRVWEFGLSAHQTARSFWFIFYHPVALVFHWSIVVAPQSVDGLQKHIDRLG